MMVRYERRLINIEEEQIQMDKAFNRGGGK